MQNNDFPKPYSPTDAARHLQQWQEHAPHPENPQARALLESVFGNSSYLSRLLQQHPDLFTAFFAQGPDATFAAILQRLAETDTAADTQKTIMPALRLAKAKTALLTALADLSGQWTLEQVTAALSQLAEHTLSLSVDALLTAAHRRGEITLPTPRAPSQKSGIITLGMGKLGGRELNYSSDIDLIIFYEPGRLHYKGRNTEQHFMNRLAHDIVTLMQERTTLGYVFRTDLRLRPDPASMPPAITTDAAYAYYESVGQNWERAAMIKARPVAGDLEAGEQFLERLRPFMWRRHLDFAAINDIHSIKRQMDTRQNKDITLKGHNIKLGIGGIREIEFYAQIHQLIWGGREPRLRSRGTCETLRLLAGLGLISATAETSMREAYRFLRTLEHRLQMVADEQTHSLPDTVQGIAHIACFMGASSTDAFTRELTRHLEAVHTIYTSSFQSAERLGGEGNLVFTGVSHDPDTLETLARMGYEHPETVSEIVMGWHHGSTRATRSKRARELLTELMPTLLKRLADTAHPDTAFLKFDEFLTNLPSGVQPFSLFAANPHLLDLIADILGSAPTLGERLSKTPGLLDSVLTPDFYGPLPTAEQLAAQLSGILASFPDFEGRMNALCQFRNERQFQAGVQLLKRMIDARQAGLFLSMLADLAITQTLSSVTAEFEKTHGLFPGGDFAVIALGKLGSREMTFSSDIDLVFVYDAPDDQALSDGQKSFPASVYYNRLAQRFLNALTATGREGKLYEVDTRLRPSGNDGPLAASMKALEHYFAELAWTFEYMAFAKARPAIAGPAFNQRLSTFILQLLTKPRDPHKLLTDALDMRHRIAREFPGDNPWDIKYAPGGLIDLDFIAHTLLLKHAPHTPGAHPGSASSILQWLQQSGHLDAAQAGTLLTADRFLGQLFNMLRLCLDQDFDPATALPGLKKLLCESTALPDFPTVENRLIEVEESVRALYVTLLTQKI